MKITKSQLKQIIKEETSAVLKNEKLEKVVVEKMFPGAQAQLKRLELEYKKKMQIAIKAVSRAAEAYKNETDILIRHLDDLVSPEDLTNRASLREKTYGQIADAMSTLDDIYEKYENPVLDRGGRVEK